MPARPWEINWPAALGDLAPQLRPETASKYLPSNPLRQMILRRFLRQVMNMLSGFSWQSLLDVGCGEGLVDYFLGHAFPGRTLVGVEPEATALAVASRLNPHARFVLADGRALPFPDHSFDVVICLEVLEHQRDYLRLIAEIKRVSAGPCLFSVPAWPWYQATNFLIGKNWRRLGEHPDHVLQFSRHRFEQTLVSHFPHQNQAILLSFPWFLALVGA